MCNKCLNIECCGSLKLGVFEFIWLGEVGGGDFKVEFWKIKEFYI